MTHRHTEHSIQQQQNTHFSQAHKYSPGHCILDHKESFSDFKETEVTFSVYSNFNGMKPEISNRKTAKFTIMWKLTTRF